MPGPDGGPDLSVLVCRPRGVEPAAAVYWVHGGGMVLGNNREGADEFLAWAQEFELVVVAPEYRLAPETPHPGPVEDCYAGLTWLARHGAELGAGRAHRGGRPQRGRRDRGRWVPQARLSQEARAARSRWLGRLLR